MRRLQGTRLAALLPAALLASCSLPMIEAGKPPEGPTWPIETAESRASKARREEARQARRDAAEAAARPADDGEARRVGSTVTRFFHRADCEEAGELPEAERVEFGTPWDALNAGYTPCRRCAAGPN